MYLTRPKWPIRTNERLHLKMFCPIYTRVICMRKGERYRQTEGVVFWMRNYILNCCLIFWEPQSPRFHIFSLAKDFTIWVQMDWNFFLEKISNVGHPRWRNLWSKVDCEPEVTMVEVHATHVLQQECPCPWCACHPEIQGHQGKYGSLDPGTDIISQIIR